MKIYLQKKADENGIAVVQNLIKILGVKVTSNSISQIKSDPQYPNLASLSNSLFSWNINSMAVKLVASQLAEIPYPAIGHLNKNGGHFVVLHKHEQNVIQYIDPEVGLVKEPIEGFSKIWTGVALLVEANEKSGEENYEVKRKGEIFDQVRIISLFVFLSLFALTPFAFIGFKPELLLWLAKVCGTALSVLLLLNQFNVSSTWIKSICHIGKKSDCDSVLNSPASKFFGIGMAEIGTIYFTGGLLALYISFLSHTIILPILALLSICSLPYTFFSVYYQWRKVKIWCPLCLGVVVWLWIEFLICAPNLIAIASVSLIGWEATIFSFILPLCFWTTVRPYVIRSFKVINLEKDVMRFKRSEKIFRNLLQNEPTIVPTNFEKEIELGDITSPYCITIVTNPFCGPCAQAHFVAKDLLSRYDGKIKIRLRFAINAKENGSIPNAVVKHIIANFVQHPERLDSVLDSWYNLHNKSNEGTERWRSGSPVNGLQHEEAEKLFHQQSEWFASSGINATPTFFLGDKKLPEEYTFSDLKYLMKYWMVE